MLPSNFAKMKKLLFVFILLYALSSCQQDKCTCFSYQICNNNKCQCPLWSEGDSCTPMKNKFIGNFAGNLYLNGGSPIPDTLHFEDMVEPTNYLDYYNDKDKTVYGIYMKSSTVFTYFIGYRNSNAPNQYLDNVKPIDCGSGQLMSDGKTITLTYHPITSNGNIDSANQYTFSGVKL